MPKEGIFCYGETEEGSVDPRGRKAWKGIAEKVKKDRKGRDSVARKEKGEREREG